MSRLAWAASMTLALCLHMTAHAAAQQQDAPLDPSSGGSSEAAQQQLASVSCASKPGERTQCPAVTAAGVALLESTGSAACLLGKTWGYDDKGVWVMDGCSGRVCARADRAAVSRLPRRRRYGPPSVSRRGASSIPETASWLDGQRRRALDQRLRARALPQPAARHSDVHRSPRQRAHDRRPQRHLPAPRDGVLQGVAGRPEAHLHRRSSGP